MASPDLQIRGGGVGVGLKKIFRAFGPQFWAPSLDPPLEWSRNSCNNPVSSACSNSCNNPVSSACSLSLPLCSKPLTQLVSWLERKEKRESEHYENRNKKQTKKQNQKHGEDCALAFGSGKI